MRIDTDSIRKKKAFRVSGEIAADALVSYFDSDDECVACAPLTYDAQLMAHSGFIGLVANLHARLALVCHRCGAHFERDLDLHPVLKLIEASSVGDVDEIVLDEDDLDTVTYRDGIIDLDDILLESVYLEIDGNCICRDDCNGICIQCGKNLNLGPCGCNK